MLWERVVYLYIGKLLYAEDSNFSIQLYFISDFLSQFLHRINQFISLHPLLGEELVSGNGETGFRLRFRGGEKRGRAGKNISLFVGKVE
jgi:hypothetical protein